jgi:hypothetical protein
MSHPWRHTLCHDCWTIERPGHVPVTLTEPQKPEPCCRCGQLTDQFPIYYRADPQTFLCRGYHPEPE